MNHSFMKRYLSLALIVALVMTTGCKKRKARKQAEADEETIVTYLETNDIEATATGTGLYYVIDSLTNGVQAEPNTGVTVYYKGYYVDGEVFGQSPGSGSNFNLGSVIQGWKEGIPLFPEGSSGRLFIPSHLGYGLDDYGDIPGGSVLIYDIEVIDVQ